MHIVITAKTLQRIPTLQVLSCRPRTSTTFSPHQSPTILLCYARSLACQAFHYWTPQRPKQLIPFHRPRSLHFQIHKSQCVDPSLIQCGKSWNLFASFQQCQKRSPHMHYLLQSFSIPVTLRRLYSGCYQYCRNKSPLGQDISVIMYGW